MTLYKDIFENSPVPRLVLRPDADKGFVFEAVNQKALAYFGFASDKNTDDAIDTVLHKTPLDIFPDNLGRHINEALKSCERAKTNITVKSIADIIGVADIQAFIFNPLFNKDGSIYMIDMIGRVNLPHNIQLIKERDDAVSMLTSIFDTSTVGIVVLDRHQRIVRVNDVFSKKFGWERTNLIGETFAKLIHEDDYSVFIDDEEKRTEDQIREFKIIKPDGREIDSFVTTAFLELTSKRRFKIVTILDVSRQKEMQYHLLEAKDDAETANRAKSAFLANMSHELRTPLNAIIGFTELIKNGTFGPIANPKYEEYLTDIHFSGQHLLDIINDVLDMSKIEAGKVEVHDREIEIADLFASVERIMHDRIHHAKLTLVQNIQPDLPDLFADRRWLRQMLMNLVSNSVKFSPQGSKILMESNLTETGAMRITITDFGQGIHESKISTVLEPFGQAGDSNTNMGQGTGLGLPLAKAMAEMHGGTLTLKSTLGKGTTVFVDFPAERVLNTPEAIARCVEKQREASEKLMTDSPSKRTKAFSD